MKPPPEDVLTWLEKEIMKRRAEDDPIHHGLSRVHGEIVDLRSYLKVVREYVSVIRLGRTDS